MEPSDRHVLGDTHLRACLPQSVRLGREICGQLDQAERCEWWLTNGRGAYAAGTVAGSLTRRYHGLLIAPLAPPLGRFLVFAKADATLIDGDWRGAFTHAFCTALGSDTAGGLTRNQILQKVRVWLRDRYTQTPQLECSPALRRAGWRQPG